MYRRSRFNKRRCCMMEEYNCPKCKVLPFMPDNPQLANSYVPYQYLDEIFDPCEALEHGTLFPELFSPYVSGQSQEIIRYLEETKTCQKEDECDGK